MSDERKRKNEEEKLKARTLLMKKNEKIFPGNLSGAGKKVNKKDIASYLNMTPECFSRMLKKYDGA